MNPLLIIILLMELTQKEEAKTFQEIITDSIKLYQSRGTVKS